MSTWIADVLGHGVVLTVSDPRVEALARAAFPRGTLPTIGHLRLELDADRTGPVSLAAGIHRYLLWSGGVRGVLDCSRWSGRLALGAGLGSDAATCRYLVIEAACLFMATAYDRLPVHAAGLVQDGAVLLVAGAPGTGKSTLAWAASNRGTAVLAEDVVYLQSRPTPTVHGVGRYVHLRREVADRLRVPDLGGRLVRAGGVPKVAVPLPTPTVRSGPPVGIVLLEHSGVTDLAALETARAAEQLAAAIPGGFGRFRDETARWAPRLAALGAWRLRVTDQPESALPLVLDLLADLVRRSTP